MKKHLVCYGLALSVFFFPFSLQLNSYVEQKGKDVAGTGRQAEEWRTRVLNDLVQAASAEEPFPSASPFGQAGAEQGRGKHSVSPDGADEWAEVSQVIVGEKLPQGPVSTLEMIEATKAWEEAGIKGEGMLISIIDTGINPAHPDLPKPRDTQAARRKTGSTAKVIPGYNWADRNQVTKDVGESQHGMHVAGIAAANGKVKGVAPEAQLLSEKVFSNYQGEVSGLSESILFAINDSIEKKADVINLSLGSPAGYVDQLSVEQQAIKRAVDHGVIVVAAAGNDGYFGSDKVKQENPDVAMIGSPGVAPDALSVASVNATTMAGVSFRVWGVAGLERVVYLPARPAEGVPVNPVQALAAPKELVYVGKGTKEDYQVQVKNKLVLIERGSISFDEKLRLAREAGAVGAIVYNNEPGPMLMSANEARQFPAVTILKSTGEALAAQLKQGKTIQVQFDGEYAQNGLPYPNGGTISAFSSWGPAPDLQFKPEIAAPGGGILSTVMQHDYAVKSGTSMATPHVAGGMALLKQAYQKMGRRLEGRDLVETLKAVVMNTAQPILDPRDIAATSSEGRKGPYPYSPRVQGAGLMQVAKAIRTPVLITDAKGKAGVSLGEIGRSTTFSLYVDNRFGQEPLTYKMKDAYGVLTDFCRDGINYLTSVPLQGAKLSFSPDKVTVAPGKRQEVKVTLSIPESAPRNIFSEGFIAFVPEDEALPVLHVPFFGFYGDWEEPRVMDAPMWQAESQEKRTGVKTTWYHDKQNDKKKYRDYLGVTGVDENGRVKVDPDKIAFSPNGDGHYDVASPSVTFLRHARQVSIDVVDSSGKVVRSLVRDEKVSKYDQSKLGIPYYYTEKEEWAWDGTAYSAQTGTYVQVPDGAYRFVVRAKSGGKNAHWQTISLPVRVDRQAPRVQASLDGSRLRWNSRDGDVQGYLLYVEGKKTGGPFSASVTSTMISQPHRAVTLVAYDYAGNITVVPVNGQSDTVPPYIQFPDDLFEQVVVRNQPYVAIRGRIGGEDMVDRVKLSIHGQPVPVQVDGSFETILHLGEGLHYVTYSATDVYGNNRQFTQRIIIDQTPPELTITNDGTEQAWIDPATRRAVLPIRFRYRDQTFKGSVSINGQMIANWEEEQLDVPVERSFSHLVTLPQGENRILVEGWDEAGNLTVKRLTVTLDVSADSLVLKQDEQRVVYTAKQAPPLSIRLAQEEFQAAAGEAVTVTGLVSGIGPFKVQVGYTGQQLEADVNDLGQFRCALPNVAAGKGKLSVVVTDALGRENKIETRVIGR